MFQALWSARSWRATLHALLGAPLGAAAGAVIAGLVVVWGAAVWSLAEGPTGAWGLAVLYVLVAVAGPVALPWCVWAFGAAQRARFRTVLGVEVAAPPRLVGGWPLALRVEALARSRAEVVAAGDAERRRIERDLHDGAQQRLVCLAMNLGMARADLADAPGPAREAIEQAHDEATRALAELRDLVRGLHPAVLNDRGLDAALPGIAARAPLPVRLRVDVPTRCSPSVEAVAYFVVSEALTNVAKHAHAGQAEVSVERVGDRLRVVVTDDGRGGATLDADGDGSRARGLAQRAAAVDGTLAIDSPPGGPTTITVELPCES